MISHRLRPGLVSTAPSAVRPAGRTKPFQAGCAPRSIGKWSRAELADELGADASAIEAALSRRHVDGVVRLDDDRISTSPATRLLDGLEWIAV
jgi:hypothetical protein